MRTAPTIHGRSWPARRLAAGLGLLGCVAALSACGGSGGSGGTATTARNSYNQGLKLAQCMRAHGVPNFPDPGSRGGIQISPSMKINPFSPSFKTAQHACQHFLPGGLSTGRASAQEVAKFVRLARCMRAHGITGFPDPRGSAPSSPVGFSVIFGRAGAFIAIPKTIDPRTPQFRRAGAACGFPVPH